MHLRGRRNASEVHIFKPKTESQNWARLGCGWAMLQILTGGPPLTASTGRVLSLAGA